MNVTWTGKQEYLHPKQKEQLDAKFAKIGHLLEVDGKGEKQARVALSSEKNRYRAEVTLNYLDHTIVGEHSDDDQFTALNLAVERLEKQMMKVRDRRRDIKKGPREGWDKGASANSIIEAEPRNPEGVPAETNGRPKVFRVAPAESKPLTVDEAMMMIDDDPYLVYVNSSTHRLAVLVRRTDGHFDLIEC